MSSPHLGGDLLHSLVTRGGGSGTGSGTNSGRNTPTLLPPNPRNPPTLHARDEDEEDDAAAATVIADHHRHLAWRPITPARPDADDHTHGTHAHHEQLHHGHHSEFDDEMQFHVNGDGLQYALGDDELPPYHASLDVHFSTLPPVLKGYLLGQIAAVVRFGVWWVGFAYLVLALFNSNSYLVGATRISFNLALLLFSPIAGLIADRADIKRLLNRTVLNRGVIYCLLIPLAWLLMESGILWHTSTALNTGFFVVFLVLVFVDGIGVSFSNVADIDSGGVNLVAAQYGLEIDDNLRNYFNAIHVGVFDLSMVVLNPLLAGMGLVIGVHAFGDRTDEVGAVADELTVLIGIGGVFLLSTIVTLACYNLFMPSAASYIAARERSASMQSMQNFGIVPGSATDGSRSMSMNSNTSGFTLPPEPELPVQEVTVTWAQCRELASNVLAGGRLTWANSRIRWRVIFFAVETSIEDAMIALIAAELASSSVMANRAHMPFAYGNLWGAGLVACGKAGGVIASVLMHKYFQVEPPSPSGPTGNAPYRPLFWFAFLGGACSLLLPLAYHLHLNNQLSPDGCTALIFFALFLFFLGSTASKIGFSTLMQSMAAEVEHTSLVFGFVAAFVTVMDAFLLMAASALFSIVTLEAALWIACGLIAAHGLGQLVFGPALVLEPEPPTPEQRRQLDLSEPLNL